jgi:hypothetical protein
MDTGFNFYKDGISVDFYDVFEPITPGTSGINTGFIANGTDLGQLFAPGNSTIITSYKDNSGNDLGNYFFPKLPFNTTGAFRTGATNNYYYAIFTNTNSEKTVSPIIGDISLNFICVGGGGGGGGSSSNESDGGGGGGGTYKHTVYVTDVDVDIVYSITVGVGGTGAPGGEYTAASGGISQVVNNNQFIVKCTGGGGGTFEGAGTGGNVFINNSTTASPYGNGGNGGDRRNGSNCYYNNSVSGVSLDIPPEIINSDTEYISNYYAGGGGGGKGDSDTMSYAGGQGGGSVNPDPNTGLGGNWGGEVSGQTASNGQPGNGYGSGGGAGGYTSSTRYRGGDGKEGIVICYALLPDSSV